MWCSYSREIKICTTWTPLRIAPAGSRSSTWVKSMASPCSGSSISMLPFAARRLLTRNRCHRMEPMTDRFAGFVVSLDKDLREDDAAATLAAIRQIKGVLDVVPEICSAHVHIAEARAQRAIEEKILEVLFPRVAG